MREPINVDDNNNDGPDKKQSNTAKGTAIAAGAGTATVTAAATNAAGGLCALVGFSSPGAIAGSTAASMMSASATSGVGAGVISAMQSAGALFMNAVGGSTVAAFASVAVPVVAAVGGYYAYNNYISMSHNTTENNQQNLMSQIKSQE